MSLLEYISKGLIETSDKPFTADKEWLHRLRNRFGLKNTKITAEALSVDEAAATFLAVLMKMTRTQYYVRFQPSTGALEMYSLQIKTTVYLYSYQNKHGF